MKFKQLSSLTFLILTACGSSGSSSLLESLVSSVSSSISSSNSAVNSSPSSQTSSSSSNDIITSSSSDSLSTTSASTTLTPSSAAPALNSIWVAPMGGIATSSHYQVNQTLTNDLTSVKVTVLVAIYTIEDVFVGYAYEAVVDGNAGSNSIRFRVGIANNTFAGFVMVSHREHGGFGVRIIDALRNNLAGKPANKDAVVEILVAAFATRSGISETYDGMIPAIEAMTLHYSANID